ncbi:MAG: hypothetical protein M1435_00215 [Actinobacteria bacterium]|nr:hypothetical protein [Actinomycetota bacterium]
MGSLLALSTIVPSPAGAAYAKASPARVTHASQDGAASGGYGPKRVQAVAGPQNGGPYPPTGLEDHGPAEVFAR